MTKKKTSRGVRPASRTAKRPAVTAKPAAGQRQRAVSAKHDAEPADRRQAVLPRGTPHAALPQEPPKEVAEGLSFPASARTIDRFVSAVLGRVSLGISPAGLMTAYFEWLSHLVASPGKQIELLQKAARKASRFVIQTARATTDPDTPHCIEPLPQDHRFSGEQWRQPPFSFRGR